MRKWLESIAFAGVVPCFAGCAHSDAELHALQKSIRALESRLARFEAKNAELNDKLFVLDARVDEFRGNGPSVSVNVPSNEVVEIDNLPVPEHLQLVTLTPDSRSESEPAPSAPIELRLHGDGPMVDVTDVPPVPEMEDPQVAANLFQTGLQSFRRGKFETARDAFERFVDSHPLDIHADSALFWVGECSYELGDFSDALTAFRRIVNEYPRSKKAADALFKVGASYERLHDGRNARRAFEKLVKRFPESAYAELARSRLK